MFCKNCGNKLPVGAGFCGECGANLTGQGTVGQAGAGQAHSQSRRIDVLVARMDKKKWIIAAGVLLALIIAIIALVSGGNSLYGTWELDGVPGATVTFNRDGTVVGSAAIPVFPIEIRGTFTVDGNVLTVRPPVIPIPIRLNFEVRGNTMILEGLEFRRLSRR